MTSKYNSLLKYISKTDKACVEKIVYSLELLRTTLDTTKKRITREIDSAKEQDSFDEVISIAEYCKQLREIDDVIKSILTCMNENLKNEHNGISKLKYDDNNTEIMYKLSETFNCTKTKPSLIMLNGHMLHVSNWREAKVSICEYLYHIDSIKLKNFINDRKNRTRKICLIAHKQLKDKKGKDRYAKIPNTDLFVYVNASAERHIEDIKLLLTEYNIPWKNVSIFLNKPSTTKMQA